MPIEVKMPKFGLTMESGRVVEWRKREGEEVIEGEVLLVVETEKITNEVMSPASGRLARILVKKGEEAPVGSTLAIILAPGEEEPKAEGKPSKADATPPDSGEGEVAVAPPAPKAAKASSPAPTPIAGRARVRATPAARRLAVQLGVDLTRIRGTGPRGMVTARDVREFATVAQAPEEGVEAPASRAPAPEAEATAPPVQFLEVPLSAMRARIASNLHRSYVEAVHTTLGMEACVDKLLELRERLPPKGRPSITAFIIKAVAHALRRHPYMNAGFAGDRLRLYKEVNVGFAVALEEGLIVPVVRRADEKSLGEVAREVEELSRRARESKLDLSEVEGATFTVSNLGMYDVDFFTPIIYPGHAGVLGVGRVREHVFLDKEGRLGMKKCLILAVTFDHRVTDGAQAALFLKSIKEYLEDPLPFLLGL